MFFDLFKKTKAKHSFEDTCEILAVAIHCDGDDDRKELEEAAKIIKELDSSPEALQKGVMLIHKHLKAYSDSRENFLAAMERVIGKVVNDKALAAKAIEHITRIINADGVVYEKEKLFLEFVEDAIDEKIKNFST